VICFESRVKSQNNVMIILNGLLEYELQPWVKRGRGYLVLSDSNHWRLLTTVWRMSRVVGLSDFIILFSVDSLHWYSLHSLRSVILQPCLAIEITSLLPPMLCCSSDAAKTERSVTIHEPVSMVQEEVKRWKLNHIAADGSSRHWLQVLSGARNERRELTWKRGKKKKCGEEKSSTRA
jgi:hypothetical protein